MMGRRINVHRRWVFACLAVLLGLCILFSMMGGKVSEHQIRTKQLNRESKVLSVLNISCQDPNRPSQDCESVVKLVSRFPQIFILGFGKAGTRALLNFLLAHPDIQGSPFEVNYFDKFYKIEGLQTYLETLPPRKLNKVNLEKSPRYIITPEVPLRLTSTLKALSIKKERLKLTVVMRNPITRAVSEYVEWNLQKIRDENKQLPPFDEMVLNSGSLPAFISTSEYAKHISKWLEYFPLEQFCFVDGDLLVENPYLVLEELENCLGVPKHYKEENFVFNKMKGFYCYRENNIVKCLGKSKGRTHPNIRVDTKAYLINHFRPHDIHLNQLTGKRFTWMEQDIS